jgi:HAD superfamily phosphatase (TIGR01668 family)
MKHKHKHTLNYLLTPDYVFPTYEYVTPEFLASIGIKALLIDIDNTLAPYEQDLPDEKIIAWFDSMKSAGVSCALISNNHPPRVELFNRDLGLLAYADSGKPGSKTLLRAMSEMGASAEETAGLGDQLLTDTLAVHRLDMLSIIVPPINDKRTLFFRFKRWLEKPFMRRYRRLHNENEVTK